MGGACQKRQGAIGNGEEPNIEQICLELYGAFYGLSWVVVAGWLSVQS